MAGGMGGFVALLKSSRDRIVILLLCIAIGGLLYRYQNLVRGGDAQFITDTKESGLAPRKLEQKFDTASVIGLLTASRGMEPWALVIVRNPFNPEKVGAVRDQIRNLYADGLRAMEEADYDRAIKDFDTILQVHDTFEAQKDLYQPDKMPRSQIVLARERKVVQIVREALVNAKAKQESAAQKEAQNDLRSALEDYIQIVSIISTALEGQDLKPVDAETVTDINSIHTAAKEKVAKLTQEVFRDIIMELLDDARTRYNAFNSKSAQQQLEPAVLEDLAVARDDLEDASKRIAASSDLVTLIPESARQDIASLLELVHTDITERAPRLMEEAGRQTDAAQTANDIEALNAVKALAEVIRRLQPGLDADKLITRIAQATRAAERVQADKRIAGYLDKADNNIKLIDEESKKSPVNWDTIETLKLDATNAVDAAEREMKAFPDITAYVQRAKDLRAKLNAIVIQPVIPNAKYIRHSEKRIFYINIPEFQRGDLVVPAKGRKPVTLAGRTYNVRITRTSDDLKTIWVEVQGKYRETQLVCEQCE